MSGRLTLYLGPTGKDCRLEIGGEELAFDTVDISIRKGAQTVVTVGLGVPQGVATVRRYKVVPEDAE